MRRIATGALALFSASLLVAPAASAQSAANALSNCKYYTKVLQDFEAGLPYCEQCLKEEADNPEARFLAGWCFAEAGKFAESAAAFGPLLEKKDDPDKNVRKFAKDAQDRVNLYYGKHFNDGVKLLGDGDKEGALAEFRIAALMNPKKVEAQLNLGFTSSETGDLEAALGAYRAALAADPTHLDARKYASVGLTSKLEALRTAQPPDSVQVGAIRDELVEVLKFIVEKDTDTTAVATASAQLGGLLLESGKRDEGLANLKKATQLDPSNAAILYNVGVDLVNAGKFAEAATVFQMTADAVNDPSSAIWQDSIYNLGLASYNSGDNAKTIETMEKLIAANPGEKDYYELLRQAAVKTGDTVKASEATKKRDELEKTAGGK